MISSGLSSEPKTARRGVLAALVAGLFVLSFGQGAGRAAEESTVDMSQARIVRVGIVVPDVIAAARSYGQLFGVGPWDFYDFTLTDMALGGEPVGDGAAVVRVALAPTASVQLALVQPLSGPSIYRDFLDRTGGGVHHAGIELPSDTGPILSRLDGGAAEVAMRAVIDDGPTVTYVTDERLGFVFELLDGPPEETLSQAPWGSWAPAQPAVIRTDDRALVQLGIVVADAEEAARAYWEDFGIGPWALIDFVPPHVANAVLHGVPMRDDLDFRIKGAMATLGNMELELLEPVRGPSTHMEFLQRNGPGVHHLSFGAVSDHDEILSALHRHGIEVEMTGRLGGASVFTYLATRERLGTIFEIVKVIPGADNTLVPYGVYPPPE